jgi:hypothetical protein
MAPSAAQISQLRRMIAEPTTATYSDEVLSGYLASYPLMDERGEEPYTWDTATEPPTQTPNPNWIPSYCLHSAAGDLWDEKASAWAGQHDFGAAGASFSRSQVYNQMMAKVRYHRSRRSAKGGRLVKWPEETTQRDFGWIGNNPEPRD